MRSRKKADEQALPYTSTQLQIMILREQGVPQKCIHERVPGLKNYNATRKQLSLLYKSLGSSCKCELDAMLWFIRQKIIVVTPAGAI